MIFLKKYRLLPALILLTSITWIACRKETPIDEDGLLITERAECFVSNFELLGTDHLTVRSKNPEIDTVACTIQCEVLFGTDLKNVYPQFTLVTDAKLDPKITGKTDFSDLSQPKTYTVVSGNRKVRKAYKIFITVKTP